jgi:hypothetical protein
MFNQQNGPGNVPSELLQRFRDLLDTIDIKGFLGREKTWLEIAQVRNEYHMILGVINSWVL